MKSLNICDKIDLGPAFNTVRRADLDCAVGALLNDGDALAFVGVANVPERRRVTGRFVEQVNVDSAPPSCVGVARSCRIQLVLPLVAPLVLLQATYLANQAPIELVPRTGKQTHQPIQALQPK